MAVKFESKCNIFTWIWLWCSSVKWTSFPPDLHVVVNCTTQHKHFIFQSTEHKPIFGFCLPKLHYWCLSTLLLSVGLLILGNQAYSNMTCVMSYWVVGRNTQTAYNAMISIIDECLVDLIYQKHVHRNAVVNINMNLRCLWLSCYD